jgi:hypothetical protein
MYLYDECTLLRIRNVYPGTLIPDPGSMLKKIMDSGSASKNFSIFNPKNCFLALGKMI